MSTKPTSSRQDLDFSQHMKIDPPLDHLETAIKWIGDYLLPEQVFNGDMLEEWAKENGFVKGEDQ